MMEILLYSSTFLSIFHTVIPVILEPVEDTTITVDEFNPAMFDCSAAGTPPPTISWVRVYENGTTEELSVGRFTPLNPSQDDQYDLESVGIVTLVNRTLNLSTTFDSDSGTYRCVASNEAGNDTQDFELVVQGNETHSLSYKGTKCCQLAVYSNHYINQM